MYIQCKKKSFHKIKRLKEALFTFAGEQERSPELLDSDISALWQIEEPCEPKWGIQGAVDEMMSLLGEEEPSDAVGAFLDWADAEEEIEAAGDFLNQYFMAVPGALNHFLKKLGLDYNPV